MLMNLWSLEPSQFVLLVPRNNAEFIKEKRDGEKGREGKEKKREGRKAEKKSRQERRWERIICLFIRRTFVTVE